MESKPTFSIIVPIYCVEKELSRCVESLIGQTYHSIEILLVDDGSPDGCPALCDAFAEVDQRVSVVHKENGGLSDARNAGLRIARGEYILYVDADDYIVPDACERFARIAEDTDVDIIASDGVHITDSSRVLLKHTCLSEGHVYSPKEFLLATIDAFEWYAPAWFNAYRREFLVDHDLYFVKGLLHEDMEMQPRVFLAAHTIAYLDYAFYQYIARDSSIMESSQSIRRAESMQVIYAEWLSIFQKCSDPILQAKLYGWLAKCYLKTCRDLQLDRDFSIRGVDGVFLMRYGLGIREKIKALLFALSRPLYYRI